MCAPFEPRTAAHVQGRVGRHLRATPHHRSGGTRRTCPRDQGTLRDVLSPLRRVCFGFGGQAAPARGQALAAAARRLCSEQGWSDLGGKPRRSRQQGVITTNLRVYMRDSPGPLGAPAAGAFPCEPLLPLTVVRSCWHQLLRAYWSKARWPRPGVGLESRVESGVHLFTPSTAAEKCAEGPIPPTPGWGGREGEALRLGGLGTCSACSHRSSYASGLICLLPQFVLRASSARPHGASSGSGNGLERRRRPSRREARCSSGAVGGGRG